MHSLQWRGRGAEATLTYTQAPSAEEKAMGGFDNVLLCKTSSPIPMRGPNTVFHFEVTVVKAGDMSVGVCLGSTSMGLPGWDDASVGYRSKTGNFLAGSAKGVPYGPPYRAGDVVGCTLRMGPQSTVTFSHNGRILGTRAAPRGVGFYACVGLSHRGVVAQTNLGQKPFAYPPPAATSQRVGTLAEELAHALDNELFFPDVCFAFPGSEQTILAHKAVLVARSMQFEMMFGEQSSASDAAAAAAAEPGGVERVLIDADPWLFRRLLKFVYCGTLRLQSKEEARELLELASIYSLDTLLTACQQALLHNFARPRLEIMKVLLHAFRTNSRDGTCLAKRYRRILKNHGVTLETLPSITIANLRGWGISNSSHRSQITSSISNFTRGPVAAAADMCNDGVPFIAEENPAKMTADILKMVGNASFADLWFVGTEPAATPTTAKGKEPEEALASPAQSPLASRSKRRLFPAHRVILAAMSPYFRRVLQERFLPKTQDKAKTSTSTPLSPSVQRPSSTPEGGDDDDESTPSGWWCPHSPIPTDCRLCGKNLASCNVSSISPPSPPPPPPQPSCTPDGLSSVAGEESKGKQPLAETPGEEEEKRPSSRLLSSSQPDLVAPTPTSSMPNGGILDDAVPRSTSAGASTSPAAAPSADPAQTAEEEEGEETSGSSALVQKMPPKPRSPEVLAPAEPESAGEGTSQQIYEQSAADPRALRVGWTLSQAEGTTAASSEEMHAVQDLAALFAASPIPMPPPLMLDPIVRPLQAPPTDYDLAALRINPMHIVSLMELGFNRNQAIFALLSNGREVETAANWIFSQDPGWFNQLALDALVAAIMSARKPPKPRPAPWQRALRTQKENVPRAAASADVQQRAEEHGNGGGGGGGHSSSSRPPPVTNCAHCGALVHRHELLRSVSCGHRCCRGCWMRRVTHLFVNSRHQFDSLAPLDIDEHSSPLAPTYSWKLDPKNAISPAAAPPPRRSNISMVVLKEQRSVPFIPSLSMNCLHCLAPGCDKQIAFESVLKALHVRFEAVDDDERIERMWSEEKLAKASLRREKLPVSIVLSPVLSDGDSLSGFLRWLYSGRDFGTALGCVVAWPRTKKLAMLSLAFDERLLYDRCLVSIFNPGALTEENVVRNFEFAERLDEQRGASLRQACITFVQKRIMLFGPSSTKFRQNWNEKLSPALIDAVLQGFKTTVHLADQNTLDGFGAILCFLFDQRSVLERFSLAKEIFDLCKDKLLLLIRTQINRVKRGLMHDIILDALFASQYCNLSELQEAVIGNILESTDNLAEDILHKWENTWTELRTPLREKMLAHFANRFKTATKTTDAFCHDCHTDFSVFVHRKHCAMCKKSFCKKCLRIETSIPSDLSALLQQQHISLPAKTCIPCHNLLLLFGSPTPAAS